MAKRKQKPVRVHRTVYSHKNQTDATLRNNRVNRRVETALRTRIARLEERVRKLAKRIK